MKVTNESKALANAILDFLERHPEKHNQDVFIDGKDEEIGCGTSMCVAGTAHWLLKGDKAFNDPRTSLDVATKALGLSYGERSVLFYEFDNERALNKLRKVAEGVEFDREDYYKGDDNAPEEGLWFDDGAWDERFDY